MPSLLPSWHLLLSPMCIFFKALSGDSTWRAVHHDKARCTDEAICYQSVHFELAFDKKRKPVASRFSPPGLFLQHYGTSPKEDYFVF
uniref:Secreted protein n=1 Tax=Rhipicephalus appendiculatus TaxID=34631 RepID=A0A131YDU0_RHIAP